MFDGTWIPWADLREKRKRSILTTLSSEQLLRTTGSNICRCKMNISVLDVSVMLVACIQMIDTVQQALTISHRETHWSGQYGVCDVSEGFQMWDASPRGAPSIQDTTIGLSVVKLMPTIPSM